MCNDTKTEPLGSVFVRERGLGHKSLDVISRFAPISSSAFDPDLTSVSTPLRLASRPPSFKPSLITRTAMARNIQFRASRFVRERGLETYSFSTGCRYFTSYVLKYQSTFSSQRNAFASANTAHSQAVENPLTRAFFVRERGLEPPRV